ncbi:MAG: hypothetical protein HQK96_03990 [Nitrospirae bacterium]|nr:hypothetical protein [Nitrospirota bacterium]
MNVSIQNKRSDAEANNAVKLIGVGRDYEKEGKLLTQWARSNIKNKHETLFLSFSHGIMSFISQDIGLIYFKNYISLPEELLYFKAAYIAIKEFSAYIEQHNLPFASTMLAAMHHTWARDLFNTISLEEIIKKHKQQNMTSNIVAVIDNLFYDKGLLTGLPNNLHYEFIEKSAIEIKQWILIKYFIKFTFGILYKTEYRSLAKASPFYVKLPTHDKNGSMESVFILIDDSGSMINLTSMLKIADDVIGRGIKPVIVTSSPFVLKMIGQRYEHVYCIPINVNTKHYANLLGTFLKLRSIVGSFASDKKDIYWKIFLSKIQLFLFGHLARAQNIECSLDHLANHFGVKVALAVGEANYTPAGGVTYLSSRGFHTAGVTTVLHMDHPYCSFWPAEHHLVYGEQVVDIMVKDGIRNEKIQVVGSEHFDRCFRRDRDSDKSYVYKLFPQVHGKKLVIVATESRARQMIEIDPSVRLLSKMEGLFTIIKLHPDDKPDEFEQILVHLGHPPNIVIAKDVDVLALVHVCDLLITMASNLIIEAGIMGIPSLVYNFSGIPCPIDLVSEGLCFGADSPEEFDKMVRLLLFDATSRAEALKKLLLISRFNGPNDGKSSERIALFVKDMIENTKKYRDNKD